jgi:hypothetical protein
VTPYRPRPPATPLSPSQRVQVAAVTLTLSVLAFMLGMCACGPAPSPLNPVQVVDVGAYGADLDDCVTGSASRAQAIACMATVKKQWCGLGGRLQVQGGCGLDAGGSSPMGPTLTKWVDAVTGDAGGDR